MADAVRINISDDIKERFWSKVDKSPGMYQARALEELNRRARRAAEARQRKEK